MLHGSPGAGSDFLLVRLAPRDSKDGRMGPWNCFAHQIEQPVAIVSDLRDLPIRHTAAAARDEKRIIGHPSYAAASITILVSIMCQRVKCKMSKCLRRLKTRQDFPRFSRPTREPKKDLQAGKPQMISF